MTDHIHGEGYCQACIEFAARVGIEEAVKAGAEQASTAWEAKMSDLLRRAWDAGYVQASRDAAHGVLGARDPANPF